MIKEEYNYKSFKYYSDGFIFGNNDFMIDNEQCYSNENEEEYYEMNGEKIIDDTMSFVCPRTIIIFGK